MLNGLGAVDLAAASPVEALKHRACMVACMILVETGGIEPPTSAVRLLRSPI